MTPDRPFGKSTRMPIKDQENDATSVLNEVFGGAADSASEDQDLPPEKEPTEESPEVEDEESEEITPRTVEDAVAAALKKAGSDGEAFLDQLRSYGYVVSKRGEEPDMPHEGSKMAQIRKGGISRAFEKMGME